MAKITKTPPRQSPNLTNSSVIPKPVPGSHGPSDNPTRNDPPKSRRV